MNISSKNSFHFIGIGGVGMAPMAMIMREKGHEVSGSDIADSRNLELLSQKGIRLFCGPHSAGNLPHPHGLVVIASSAIGTENPELAAARSRGVPIFRRGEFLAKIAESYEKSIAVGGSHGKTSITAMTTHGLIRLGHSPGFMVGGKVRGWKQNGAAGDGGIFVTESDESDGTNSFMGATVAVVSNLDDDHAWNFAGGEDELYSNFAKFAGNAGQLVFGGGPLADKLFSFHKNKKSFGVRDLAKLPGAFPEWPDFQKLNALISAHAISLVSGVAVEHALSAISDFPGVERRMSVRFRGESTTLIEDYAHHPAELSALMDSLLRMKGVRRIHVVFQPHRYARLKKYFSRFVRELSRADKVTVLPVFSAWCPDDDINSQTLVEELNRASGKAGFANFAGEGFDSTADTIAKDAGATLLAIVGAGDCDKLVEKTVAALGRLSSHRAF